MCSYYAYTYMCGHTDTAFANYCSRAQISQRKCHGQTQTATLSASVKMDYACEKCLMNGHEAVPKVALRR